MEEGKRKIEVCSRSLDLARQYHSSSSYLRAFAHYLIHKNVLWELSKDEKESIKDTANVKEIFTTFEKVKSYFDSKLEDEHLDSSIWDHWKATNEQFLDLLTKMLKEEFNIENVSSENNGEAESISELLISHSTDHAINLFKNGQYLDACHVFDDLLMCPKMESNPNTTNAKENRNRISNLAADRWHFTMLNDKGRNDAFKEAVGDVIQSFPTGSEVKILDIGAGSGLLSLYAAEASTNANINASIIACEASAPIAEIASKVLSLNKASNESDSIDESKVSDKFIKEIKLLQKLSAHLSENEVQRKSINLLVTETFDAGLLGEHVLETLDHAFKNLLAKNCSIIPCRASVYIALIESRAVANRTRMNGTNVGSLTFEEINITAKALDEEPYTSERLSSLPGGFKFVSDDSGEKLIDINFENPEQIREYLKKGRSFQRRIKCSIRKNESNSQVDAAVLWFELHLLDKNKYGKDVKISTKPILRKDFADNNCWEQAVFPLTNPIGIGQGDEIELKVKLKGHFSLESCEKIKPDQSDKKQVSKTDLQLPSHIIAQLNDGLIQESYLQLSQRIDSSISKHERWSGRKRLDILDLTDTCFVSLQLLAQNQMDTVTIAQTTTSDLDGEDEEDITKNNFALRIQYVCELALTNKLKVDNIDCVMSLDQVPDRSYDLVLLNLIEPSGRLSQENIEKIPILKNKLRLTTLDSTLLPGKLTVHCQLIQSDKLHKMSFINDKNVLGFKLATAMNIFSVNHLQDIDLNSLMSSAEDGDMEAGKILSEPIDIFQFDLTTLSLTDVAKKDFEISATNGGIVNGIAY